MCYTRSSRDKGMDYYSYLWPIRRVCVCVIPEAVEIKVWITTVTCGQFFDTSTLDRIVIIRAVVFPVSLLD